MTTETKEPNKPLSGESLVDAIVTSLEDALGQKIVIIDLKNLSGAADWFIICESDNDAHIRACANRVLKDLAETHTRPWQKEGVDDGRWVLLDFSDVVVHIMLDEVREYYTLEELWSQGKTRKIEASFQKTRN